MNGLFKQNNFIWLWLGQLVSSYGDRLNQMACVAMVSTLLPGSTLAISFLFTASQLPVLLLGPIFGVYVDRWDSKKCMLYCDALRCLLVLTIPVVMTFWPLIPTAPGEGQGALSPMQNSWLIFLTAIVFLVGALTRIFVPARLSLMPVILEKRHLMSANAVLVGTIMLATVLGLASGDVLLGWIGWRKGFIVDALTFLISGLFIWMIVMPKHPPTPHEEVVEIQPPHFGREFLEGIKILVSHRAIFLAIGSLCMLTGGAGAIFVLITVYIKTGFPEIFAGGAYGVFLGTVGFGAMVGALILTWAAKHHSKERLISTSFFLTGLISIPFVLLLIKAYQLGTLEAYLKMDFMGFLVGVFVAPVMISCDTWLQEIIPEKLRGRVFATKETLITLSFVAVNIPIGKIADQMSIDNRNVLMIGIAIFLSLVSFIWSFLIFRHETK